MEVPPLQVLGRDAVLRSAGMLPVLYPGCRSAHVVALRSTTRLPLPGAVGFLPYRGDLCAKFLVIMLSYLNSYACSSISESENSAPVLFPCRGHKEVTLCW